MAVGEEQSESLKHAPLETATSPLSPENQLSSSDGGRGARSAYSSLMGSKVLKSVTTQGRAAPRRALVLWSNVNCHMSNVHP